MNKIVKNVTVLALILLFSLLISELACAALSRGGLRPQRRQEPPAVEEVKPLTQESFENSLSLDGSAGSVLSFELDEGVYKGLHSSALNDLCVFDAEGNPVPFRLRPLQAVSKASQARVALPFFRWNPKEKEALPQQGMDIEVDAKGGIVRIRQPQGAPQPLPGEAKGVVYLVDLATLQALLAEPGTNPDTASHSPGDHRTTELTARFGGEASFVYTVSMQTSDDLLHWRPVGGAQALARVKLDEAGGGVADSQDTMLLRENFSLPSKVGRYLLFELSGSEAPLVSLSATASFSRGEEIVRVSHFEGSLSEDKRSVRYDLKGHFPQKSLQFELRNPDILHVRLFASNRPEKDYAHDTFTLYRLEKNGVSLQNPPRELNISKRFWRLEAQGNVSFIEPPALSLTWKPLELRFLARGKGPWTLAYGRDEAVHGLDSPILNEVEAVPASRIEAAVTLAETAPAATTQDDTANSLLLWISLGAAVVFLTGLALWLMRSMKKAE